MKIAPKKHPDKKIHWQVRLGITLIAASAAVYIAQILIFRRNEETFFYMMQDLAFVPISVLLVTLIVEGVLNYREKQAMKTKLFMVIGTFYTDMGTELLRTLAAYDRNVEAFRGALLKKEALSLQDLEDLSNYVDKHDYGMESSGKDIEALKAFLMSKREAILRLLENPNLLEHETFTDLLWAVSHLAEELAYRKNLSQLTVADRRHIEMDMARAYAILTSEWLAYVRHLRMNYPYIFSLVMRINPFYPEADAEYKE